MRLADGDLLAADPVIVGIGIVPAVAPLISAGAQGTTGVRVDEYCRSTLTDVYAIGDCAEHRNRFAGHDRPIRVGSVQNANDQAVVAAKAITGAPEPYGAVPRLWSNRFDLRLLTIGLSTGFDRTVIRGDPARRSFSIVYLRDGRVIALDCVNATRDYVRGRAMMLGGTRAGEDRLACLLFSR